eukprot:972005-Pleurochrysis_carterae.AAC.1
MSLTGQLTLRAYTPQSRMHALFRRGWSSSVPSRWWRNPRRGVLLRMSRACAGASDDRLPRQRYRGARSEPHLGDEQVGLVTPQVEVGVSRDLLEDLGSDELPQLPHVWAAVPDGGVGPLPVPPEGE